MGAIEAATAAAGLEPLRGTGATQRVIEAATAAAGLGGDVVILCGTPSNRREILRRTLKRLGQERTPGNILRVLGGSLRLATTADSTRGLPRTVFCGQSPSG